MLRIEPITLIISNSGRYLYINDESTSVDDTDLIIITVDQDLAVLVKYHVEGEDYERSYTSSQVIRAFFGSVDFNTNLKTFVPSPHLMKEYRTRWSTIRDWKILFMTGIGACIGIEVISSCHVASRAWLGDVEEKINSLNKSNSYSMRRKLKNKKLNSISKALYEEYDLFWRTFMPLSNHHYSSSSETSEDIATWQEDMISMTDKIEDSTTEFYRPSKITELDLILNSVESRKVQVLEEFLEDKDVEVERSNWFSSMKSEGTTIYTDLINKRLNDALLSMDSHYYLLMNDIKSQNEVEEAKEVHILHQELVDLTPINEEVSWIKNNIQSLESGISRTNQSLESLMSSNISTEEKIKELDFKLLDITPPRQDTSELELRIFNIEKSLLTVTAMLQKIAPSVRLRNTQ